MRRYHIAFLTTEFVTEFRTGGGLGNYLARMSRLLHQDGHAVEVFVVSTAGAGLIDFDGVRVVRVPPAERDLTLRAAWRLLRTLRIRAYGPALNALAGARGLARALAEREVLRRFDLVQSADYLAAGACVHRQRGRVHVVRCSYDRKMWTEINDDVRPGDDALIRLEQRAIRRADMAYAPSQFLANELHRRYGLRVRVVRPPAAIEVAAAGDAGVALPARFLLHFGRFDAMKGSPILAAALPRVWAAEPEFTMLWAGQCAPGQFERWAASWGPRRTQVTWLGALEKPALYAVLQRAEAAVLPSQVDNLPNTVIESLEHGVPVIGSAGASIDELVEPGVTGELVPIGDAAALADALIRVWRGQTRARRGFRWHSAVRDAMEPAAAVDNLLRLAGLRGGPAPVETPLVASGEVAVR